jgi:dipeptidyl aminopeptidase/acylaminoacyl peptidase
VVADAKSGTARQVSPLRLNAIASSRPYSFRTSGAGSSCAPFERRGPEPLAPSEPEGPVVQESGGGKKAPARTYQDLLKSAFDETLFEYHFTSQLVTVMADGLARPIGPAGLVTAASPSPDGAYLLVQTLHRPFSYLVPLSRFPSRSEVLSLPEGRSVAVVADLPLAEDVPSDFDAERRGRRQIGWRQDAPSRLHVVEAEDDGDPRKAADFRDRVSLLAAPFTGQPTPLIRLAGRFSEIAYGDDGLALVTERWWKTRKTRTWRVAPGRPAEKARLLFDRSSEDRYSDPGDPLMERTATGASVLKKTPDGRGLYLVGTGASAEGDRPFLDLLPVDGSKATRLFRSEAPRYEVPVDVLEDGRLLLRRESPTEPPDLYVKDLSGKGLRRLTTTEHPVPAFKSVKKELLKYTRKDGVALTATLYTPPGWDPSKGPLPVLMWAYPQEFKSASAAGQVQDSPYRFVRPSVGGPLPFLARGWAVLDDPSFPIVGEGKAEPNDTYVEQLVSSAEAAVERW